MNPQGKRKTVFLVVDDHPVVVESIATLLRSRRDGDIILTARSAGDALATAWSLCIDIAIVDLSLPDMDGLRLIAELRKKQGGMKIIVFTSHDEPWVVAEMVKARLDAAVFKGEDVSGLELAVESVEAGLHYFSKRFTDTMEADPDPFTDRDIDILRRMSRGETAEAISAELFVSVSTVEYHRRKLMRRLGASNNAHLVAIAIRRGLIRP